MTIGREIKERRKALGWTLLDMEAKTGIDSGNLSRLERGIQGYSEETLKKIAGAFGITIAELFSKPSNVEAVTQRGMVPLISWVQAGEWCEAADPYNVGDAEEWLPCPVKHGPKTYALRVRGESMRNPGNKPSFDDGDIIFVDPERQPVHKSLVVTKLVGSNEVTFKRLLIDGDTWYLEALNPAWPSRIIPIDREAHVCGVVIARLESFV